MRRTIAGIVVAAFCALTLGGCRAWILFGSSNDNVDEAERLTREERFDDAIDQYRTHIERRLKVRERPEWENPYLYLLSIGDLQLRKDSPEEALASYEEAEKMGVDSRLISDRYRMVARYFEERDKDEDAVRVLTKYRDRDPLLFDGMLDRISKRIVRAEEAGAGTPSPSAPPK